MKWRPVIDAFLTFNDHPDLMNFLQEFGLVSDNALDLKDCCRRDLRHARSTVAANPQRFLR